MSEHTILLSWQLDGDSFDYEHYSRRHSIVFDGQNRICASASPEFHGDVSCVNPEQAFIASLASCHMLTFLAIASKRNLIVAEYRDNATGIVGKNQANKIAITKVTLKPSVTFQKEHAPDQELFDRLLEQAHRGCFIANSVASCVEVGIDAELIIATH